MPPFFPATDLYAITDDSLSLGRPLETVAAALLAAGIKILQYREKRKKARERLGECRLLRAMTREAGACFIVNDYLDIALLAEADGIHVGQEDLPVAEIRRLAGGSLLVGVSTHSPAQAAQAAAEGADYIGVGPLFATQTKEDVCAPVGLEYLEHVAAVHGGLPFVAIGGIKRRNIGQVVSRGASCCCLVSELVSAPDIPARVAEVRRAMRREPG
ncbi:MAG: thiamine phosphate synthase [Desulfovibrio sp.]|jgi:thiamine-phosphate pyrophosphorylase|nr:thiamine phosphate synthase [Desulfovibrio sp.]